MNTVIVLEALVREARLLRAKLRVHDARIRKLEERYGVSSDEFLTRFKKGGLGNEEDYFIWLSYLRARAVTLKKLKEIEKEIQRLQRLR